MNSNSQTDQIFTAAIAPVSDIPKHYIPVPISVWETGCSWRTAAIESLEKHKRAYRVAFMSAHISGQRAAITADLAIAPIPLSTGRDGIVRLGKQHGLPNLKEYALGLEIAAKPSDAVKAAADHLRASLRK